MCKHTHVQAHTEPFVLPASPIHFVICSEPSERVKPRISVVNISAVISSGSSFWRQISGPRQAKKRKPNAFPVMRHLMRTSPQKPKGTRTLNKSGRQARETTAQQLRALAVLFEDWGWIPDPPTVVHNHL